ncbi:MAG: hypothetical protein QM728_03505 [Gordonia sp. (in: high G+C Gram-positive bacteria)]|uniref:hypothetical protein n=1 Tax=Gordonia sp. (in: high G+C Gram-positive bacteria) TaxID=84139 RepID=UPI0039E65DA6
MLSGSGPSASMTTVRLAASTALIPILIFGLWGAYATTVEYERGAIVTSLLIVPRRSAFYLAKIGLVAVVAMVGVATALVLAVAVVALATPPPGRAVGPLWAIGGAALIAGGVAAVGAAGGFVLRGSLTTAAALLIALLGPGALGPALGAGQRWVNGSGPGGLVARAVGSEQAAAAVGWAAGAVVFVVVVTVVTVAGWRSFAASDH